MTWYNNPVLRASLQSAFKRSNQRIVTLGKKFGKTSPIYKNEIDKFFSPNYKQFMSTSKSGNLKFDVRSLNKYILSGEADRGVVNQLLTQAAGIRIDEQGNVYDVKNEGIKTVDQIRERARKRASRMGMDPHEMDNEELAQFENEMIDFGANFQVAYDAFIARYGEQAARDDIYIGQMYDRGGKRLSYNKMIEINRRFNSYKDNERKNIQSFEDVNGGNL